VARLSGVDEPPYIRGRAAEASGLLACVDGGGVTVPDGIGADWDEATTFISLNVMQDRFAEPHPDEQETHPSPGNE